MHPNNMTVVTITVVTVFKNDFLIDTFDDIDASSDSFGISDEIIYISDEIILYFG